MTYLSAKKIYPGNWVNALNGWYKNIDANPVDGTRESSQGGPTSVLAVPGYRYFQQRGYVPVTAVSGAGVTVASIIIPSPYRQDDTRTDITGMVISGSATSISYVYRTALSVASGWGDDRVASGIYNATGNVISVGRSVSSLPTAASGVGEGVFQANLVSTVSGTQAGEIFFAAGLQGLSTDPFITATGAAGTVPGPGTAYYPVSGSTTVQVFSKATANTSGSTAGGFYISSGDSAAGRVGYLVLEVCYVQPDVAPQYEDIESYLPNRTVS
jgi:hypothetical protein